MCVCTYVFPEACIVPRWSVSFMGPISCGPGTLWGLACKFLTSSYVRHGCDIDIKWCGVGNLVPIRQGRGMLLVPVIL